MNNLKNPDIQAHFLMTQRTQLWLSTIEVFKMYETYMPPDYYLRFQNIQL